MSDTMAEKELTSRIISAAITVHRELGPGFLESVYEAALCIELTLLGIPFERQRTVHVTFKGHVVGEHRLDLLVDGRVVVELKAIFGLDPVHYSIARSYMKATCVDIGLILNFGTMPLTVKRVGSNHIARYTST